MDDSCDSCSLWRPPGDSSADRPIDDGGRGASERRVQAGNVSLLLSLPIFGNARAQRDAESMLAQTTSLDERTRRSCFPTPAFALCPPFLCLQTPRSKEEWAPSPPPFKGRCRARRARSTWPSLSTRACASSWPAGGKVSTQREEREEEEGERAFHPPMDQTHTLTAANHKQQCTRQSRACSRATISCSTWFWTRRASSCEVRPAAVVGVVAKKGRSARLQTRLPLYLPPLRSLTPPASLHN